MKKLLSFAAVSGKPMVAVPQEMREMRQKMKEFARVGRYRQICAMESAKKVHIK